MNNEELFLAETCFEVPSLSAKFLTFFSATALLFLKGQ
jgi:hypothetical protein